MVKNSTSWGKVAKWYDSLLEEGEDTYQERLIRPNLLRLLAVKPGEEVLDVGCGQGYFSRLLAEAGANVLGVDVAPELIQLAKTRAGKKEKYLLMSAEKLTGLGDQKFDAVICVLALQNIKNFQAAVGEMARVLKPAGRALLVLNHPAFRVPTASGWGYDESSNTQYRRIEKYISEFSQQVDMTQGITDPKRKRYTWSFHHPLQVYAKAFFKAGLGITRLEEWMSHKISDKGPRKAAEDRARKEIPLFICLELRKLGSA